MDSKTTLAELKSDIEKFCTEREWDQFHLPIDLDIGAATESAELLEIFRFKSEDECHCLLKDDKALRQEVGDELADVLFFVVRIAQKYNFDLSEIFAGKMAKNRAKYPVEKSKGSNKKYTQL